MSDTFLPGSGFDTYEQQDKVLVGLGGGTAAKVAVRILQQQGFAVAGAVVKLSAEEEPLVQSAKEAAKALGIECATLNAEALAGTGSTPCGRPPLCPADGGRPTGHPVHRHRPLCAGGDRGRRRQPYLPAGRPGQRRERRSGRSAAGYRWPGSSYRWASLSPGGCDDWQKSRRSFNVP